MNITRRDSRSPYEELDLAQPWERFKSTTNSHNEGAAKVRRRLSQNPSRIGGLNRAKHQSMASSASARLLRPNWRTGAPSLANTPQTLRVFSSVRLTGA
jgi:hypothetical protein